MAKKKLLDTVRSLIDMIVAVAVAGLFLDGTTLTNPILSYVPAMAHEIIGWGALILAALTLLLWIGRMLKITKIKI